MGAQAGEEECAATHSLAPWGNGSKYTCYWRAPSTFFSYHLKTSKDRSDEQNQGHLVRGCESKGVNPSHLLFNKVSSCRGMGELSVDMGGYRCALMGAWGSWRRANEKWGVFVTGWGDIFDSLWMVLSWKQGQELGKLPIINKVLTVWGQLLQRLLSGYLDGHKRHLLLWAGAWFPGRLLRAVDQHLIFIHGLTIGVHIFSFPPRVACCPQGFAISRTLWNPLFPCFY